LGFWCWEAGSWKYKEEQKESRRRESDEFDGRDAGVREDGGWRDSGSGCAAIPYSRSGEVHGITEEDVIVLQRRGCCVSFHGREASER